MRRTRLLIASLIGAALVFALVLHQVRERSALRSAHPLTDGRLRVEGISAPVEIIRDAQGVPHVRAESVSDAFFGLGFVHAQDRLAQMLWLARTAAGRSAEIVGVAGLDADRLARTLDLHGLAEGQRRRLDAYARDALDAYARGVNQRIARVRSGAAAPPLALRQLEIPLEEWTPADSLAVANLYAWGLSGSVDASLVLADLIERLGGFGARRFFPPGARGDLLPPPEPGPVTASRFSFRDSLRRAAGLEGRSLGSSAWVVGGGHTASGRPILVADSHLAPTAPPLLHVIDVRGGDLHLAGASLPGVPGVWTGHNGRVAWASTHARAVATDLYVEILHPRDPERYHDGSRWRPLEERDEVIRVRGRDDEALRVRSTRHGPLLPASLQDGREPLAVHWVGGSPRRASVVSSLLAMARAADAEGLLAALSRHDAPALAVVYADASGAAGMQVAGWIPRRATPSGLVPLPGRARWYDWQGRVAFEQLPRVRLASGRGWAIAADNPFEARSDGAMIEWMWRTGERGERIEELLRGTLAQGPVELRRMAALQADVGSSRTRALVAHAFALVDVEALGAESREVARLLSDWDGRATSASLGAAAYHVFLESLTDALLRPRLGEALLARYRTLPQADPAQVVFEILSDARSGRKGDEWSDPEVVGGAVRESLRQTWIRLSYRLGSNRKKWGWGRLHPLRFRPFVPDAALPVPGPLPFGGGSGTINVGEYDPAEPFAVRVASVFRFAVDAGDLDQALFSLAPGQSEHPGHPQYRGGLARWLAARPELLSTSWLLAEQSGAGRLLLEPAEGPP